MVQTRTEQTTKLLRKKAQPTRPIQLQSFRLSLPLTHCFNPELPRYRPKIPGGFDPQVLWLMIVFEAAANGGGLENSTLMMVDEVNQ
jgi:hypothetical protein